MHGLLLIGAVLLWSDEAEAPEGPRALLRRLRAQGAGDDAGADPAPGDADPDESPDDETALARMIESESDDPAVRIVVGWMASEAARRRHQSVYRRLTGVSGQYGPQKLGGVIRYASTRKRPSPEARHLARDLLAGAVQPSRAIRAHGLSSWVEVGVRGNRSQSLTAQRVLDKQGGPDGYGGIYGRIEGTNWYLFDPKAPPLQYDPADPGSAAEVLAQVPELPAVDEGRRVA